MLRMMGSASVGGTEMTTMRINGFYWLYRRGKWIIGEWRGEAWFVSGDSHAFNDAEWELISERITFGDSKTRGERRYRPPSPDPIGDGPDGGW